MSDRDRYGIVLSKNVMVPMRDGVRLAFDVYRPGLDGAFVEGRFPTIMLHTPYDKTDVDAAFAKEPDWTDLGPNYVQSLAYDFSAIADYLRATSGRDYVMIVLGDHQPLAAVSGEGARWDVPVHVFTSRSDRSEEHTSELQSLRHSMPSSA